MTPEELAAQEAARAEARAQAQTPEVAPVVEEVVVTYPPEVMRDAVREVLVAQVTEQRAAPAAQAPQINPNAGNDARVIEDENASRRGLERGIFNLFKGLILRQEATTREGIRTLMQGGHYGPRIAAESRAANDYYSTLVNADGGFLLPTTVVQEIEEVATQHGAIGQSTTVIPVAAGDLKIPGGSGTIDFTAIVEGAEIQSSIRSFLSLTLNPKKWAAIVPMTREVSFEAGPLIVADMLRAAGRGVATARDNAAINGDGTGTFHGITGILAVAGTGQIINAAGGTSPEDLTPDNLILIRNQIPAAIRNQGVYLFHPDMEAVFLTKKDSNNQYLFDYRTADGVPTLKGRPVFYTESFPGLGVSVSTDFGIYAAMSYWKTAVQEGAMSVEELLEATVSDADTGTAINLGSMDVRAFKMRSYWDMGTNFANAFSIFTTAAV